MRDVVRSRWGAARVGAAVFLLGLSLAACGEPDVGGGSSSSPGAPAPSLHVPVTSCRREISP